MSLTDDDKRWIAAELSKVEERLDAKIERVETALLTEFHKWAFPNEARQRTNITAIRVLEA